jgi:hypothetical protein
MRHEAQDVGVVAPDRPVLDPQRVDGAQALGPGGAPVDA